MVWCDVYVSCSRADAGLAASLAEAMAAQRLVIASDVADNAYWITRVTGILFEVGNSRALANALNDAAKMDRRAIGAAARRLMKQKNDLTSEMNRCRALHRKFLCH